MNINEYLASAHKGKKPKAFPGARLIVCRDGFSLSVQASHTHYCSPKNDTGPWTTVEVGYPSAPPELIQEFAEDGKRPTKTVYS